MSPAGLTRLVYYSRMAPSLDAAGRLRLAETSRRRNAAAAIRSGLVLYRGICMQALEGDSEALADLFRRLLVDPHHRAVTLVQLARIENHALPPVSFAMLEDEETIEELLARLSQRPPFDPRELDAAVLTALVADACLARTYFLD